jgi:c-di-AMP phosphodiesterase-like protein
MGSEEVVMKEKYKLFIRPRMIFYFIFLYLFALTGFIVNWQLGLAQFVASTIVLVLFIVNNLKSSEQFKEYIENLSFNIESATHNSVLNSPFPMVILKGSGEIIWYNTTFSDMVSRDNITEQVTDFFSQFVLPKAEGELRCSVYYSDKSFDAYGILVDTKNETDDNIYVYYFVDTTDYSNLLTQYYNDMIVKGFIYFDNLDEITKQISDSERTAIISQIEKIISDYIILNDGVLNKFDRDRYSFIIERKNFDIIRENKFDILKKVKQVNTSSNLPITLSIGVGVGESLIETESYSRAALDMALGRGGDQAVIKVDNEFFYFGGQNKETEKRTKVRSRIIALSFKELIESSDKIIVMGHKSADMDLLGAALGLSRIAKAFEKKAYIVIEEQNRNTEALFSKTREDKDYTDVFISPSQAELIIDNRTLLTIVDTHREALLSAPELLKSNSKIFLIDHHRKGADFIKNSYLTFHEPYASSTSELVVEMLQYLDDKVKLKRIEAESLYAGILIDTQNFTLRTGVRTFEAASYLRKTGMEPIAAKDLIKNDLESYIKVSEIVKSAEIYNHVAIAKYYGEEENSIFIAQAADDLIEIKNIKASFVIFKNSEGITISARSNGDVNVQLIMEKLGGGGHQLVAGAQLKDTTVDKAALDIKQTIDNLEDI